MKKIYYIFIFILIISFNKVYADSTEDYFEKTSSKLIQIEEMQNSRTKVNNLYPVGSIYISINNTNPSNFLGGTWEQYAKGKTLVGVDGNTYKENQAGGTTTKTLKSSNIPAHTHNLTASGTVSSSYSGKSAATSSYSHYHSLGMHPISDEETDERDRLRHTLVASSISTVFEDRVIVLTSENKKMSSSKNGEHSHAITPTGNVWSNFSGYSTNTYNTGSANAFDVMNPYITVYIWRRTA